jgi:hypothetical protein
MTAHTHFRHSQFQLPALHAQYLALLPRIETHARIYFRHIRCPNAKADLLQEMRALAWQWLVRLDRRGKDVNDFVAGFVTLLARAVNSGRQLTGQAKAKDVLNPRTQRRHGFTVEPLPASLGASFERLYASPHGQGLHDAFEERLQDNLITPVPDQVQFRIDWPAWLGTLTSRERRLIRAMACNERTSDLSRQFEVSRARISQLRREFHDAWEDFCGESVSSYA